MKKLATALSVFIFLLDLFVCPAAGQSSAVAPLSAMQEGVLRIKFSASAVSAVETSTGVEGVAVQRSATGVPQTGLASVDQISQQYGAARMTRVFRPAGKYEPRHRAAGLHQWYRVELEPGAQAYSGAALQSAIAAYQANPSVRIAEPVLKKKFSDGYEPGTPPRLAAPTTRPAAGRAGRLAVTNDPLYGSQWHYDNTGQNPPGGTPDADIDLPEAQNIESGDPAVVVSIHDGGLDVDHEDLAANLWVNEGEVPDNGVDDDDNGYVDDVYGYNFADDQGAIVADEHGTHVGGTVGAVTNNGTGVAGVAGGDGSPESGVRLMSTQVFGASGSSGGAAESYTYAADNGAVISQNSWGYINPGTFEQAVLDAIDYYIANAGSAPEAAMQGGLVIFAAGNDGTDDAWYPGYYEPTVAVAATGIDDQKSGYSNYGAWVDIAAPGGNGLPFDENDVLSTVPDDNYGYLAGTSMACPHASGVAGLIVSAGLGVTNDQAREILQSTTDDIDSVNPDFAGQLGTGRINAFGALQAFDPDDETAPGAITDLAASLQNSINVELTWTAVADDAGDDASGPVFNYQIRYSTDGPISTPADFAAATPAARAPAPGEPGAEQSALVTGLDFDTPYWFAVRAIDDNRNTALSNTPSVTTEQAPVLAYEPNTLTAELEELGDSAVVPLTLSNEGPPSTTLAFSFPAFAAQDVVQATPVSQRNDPSRPLEDASYTDKEKDPHSGAGHPVRLGAGGPDAFGYEWIDSNEPGGPAFNFTDISEAGTALALTDESIATVPLPFGFSFYGEEQTEVTISSNGFLAFNDAEVAFENAPIPDAAPPNGLIAPFWDDLDPGAGAGAVYYYDDADNDRFIVQFTDVQAFSGSPDTTYTFQAILNEDGTLLFQYADVEGGGDLQSATVGIENYDGSDGLQVAFNTSYVEDGLAVALAAPPSFLADVEPASGTIEGGSSQEVGVTFSSADVDEPGLYDNELALQTNDPTSPVVAIPALLDAATGPPQLAVYPEAVDFGEVLAGGTARDSVFIVNDGGGILEVTALSVEGENFDAGVFPPAPTPIFIPAGDSVNVNVAFTAPGLGAETATLTIESSNGGDTPTVTVLLEGEGVPAPVAAVSPDSLSETIEIGQTATDVLTLVNSGEGPLSYETLFQLTPDDSLTRADVAARAPRSRPAHEKSSSLLKAARPQASSAQRSSAQPLDAMDAVYQLDDGTAENAIGVAQGNLDLMWLNAFEVVEGAGTITSVSTAWGFPDASTGNPPAGTEALALVYEDPDDDGDPTNAVLRSQSPITVQHPGTDEFTTAAIEATEVESVFFVAILYPDQAPNIFPAPLDESSEYQEASWAAFDVNADFDLEDLSNNSNPPSLIGEAGLEGNWLLRADAGPGVEVVTVSPDSGSVAPGELTELTVTYDATELTEAAVYEGDVLITNNDPVHPVLAVPTTLDVNFGDPSIAVTPDAVDFGGVFVGGAQTASVTVVNDGAGPLDITNLSTDSDAFEVTLDSTLTVPIGDSTSVGVTFAPDAVQTYSGTLTIENNAADVEIPLSGEGLPAPVLAVAPDSLSEALQVGETSTDVLTLTNEGGSALTFQAMFTTRSTEGLTPSDVAAPASAGAGAAGPVDAAAAATAPYEGPATSAAPLDVTYQLDDGTSENALGLGGLGDTYDMMWLNAFEAVEGAGIITSISTTWGADGSATAPPAGKTGLALVYEDPDDDGDPTNAELLSQTEITVQDPGTNTFTTVSIEPTEVEGAFFVAVLLEENAPGTFVAPLDESSEYQEASWFAGASTGEDFNIEDLSANSTPPTEFGTTPFPGNLLLRAEGSEVNFVTVSPDSGSVAPGASQELTVTYDATELDPGAYEGDIVITSNDPLHQSVNVPVTLQVLPTLTVTPEPGPDSTRSVSAGEEFLVPLTVSQITGLEVRSYAFTLTFAEALFAPVGVETEGTLSEGVALAVNTEVPGQIRVAAADSSGPTSQGEALQDAPMLFDIEGEGTLLFVRLRATQAVGASSELAFSQFLFNGGGPPVVTLATTYRIGALLGDVSGDGEITALDASQVLRYAVGLIDLSGAQLAAADVSGDGDVGAYDASLILEFVGGSLGCFPAENDCEGPEAPAVLAAQSSGQRATLAWGTPTQARPSGVQTSSAGASSSAGQPLFSVPLVLSGQGGVRSVELSAELAPSQVSVEGVEANLPEDWLVAHRFADDGTLQIAMAGGTPLSAGQIATVKLRRLSGAKSAVGQPPLELAGQMRFNEAALVQMQAAELVALPETFTVKGNYPNPFSRRTKIVVDLPESAKMSVRVYDVLGRRVLDLTRELAAGAGRTVEVNGARLAPGAYFYRVVAESSREQRTGAGRMTLVK